MDIAAAVAQAYEHHGPDAEPGQFARAIRTALGLSLKAVADKIGDGTHFTTISKLEKGKMEFTHGWGRLLAQVYGVEATLFHMPFSSLDMPKRIPIYTNIWDILAEPKGPPDYYDSYMGESDTVIGYQFNSYPDIVSELPIYRAIVETLRTDPKPNKVYMVRHEDVNEPVIGIYRQGGEDGDRIVPWLHPLDALFYFSERKMDFLGEVLELRRLI